METVIKKRGRPPGSAKKSEADTKDWMTEPFAPEPIKDSNQNQPKTASKPFNKVYAGQQELDHDLFKLEPAPLKRNVSYNSDHPVFEMAEHAHFFHSIDSRGRPQEFSNKVGGHFHQIVVDDDGTAHCSPPMMEIKTKAHGRTTTTYQKLKYDDHVHEVSYKFSEKVKPMVLNPEWIKVQAGMVDHTKAKIDDVEEYEP